MDYLGFAYLLAIGKRIEVRIVIEIAGSVLPTEILQDPSDLRLEGRQGSLDRGPHSLRIRSALVVDENMTHTNPLRPRHFWMGRPDLGG